MKQQELEQHDSSRKLCLAAVEPPQVPCPVGYQLLIEHLNRIMETTPITAVTEHARSAAACDCRRGQQQLYENQQDQQQL